MLRGRDQAAACEPADQLALAYLRVGRLGEAIPLFEQNLDVCIRVQGHRGVPTMESRNTLAAAYESAGWGVAGE